jgi:hypothetical protein
MYAPLLGLDASDAFRTAIAGDAAAAADRAGRFADAVALYNLAQARERSAS